MGQPRDLMNRATAAVLTGDLAALRDIYAPDVVATTPDEGELHGIDRFIEWNQSFVGSFTDREYVPLLEHETADCAIDQGDFVGTNTEPMRLPDGQTVPPTGKQVRVRAADVATVRDGRIVRHDFYFDQLDLLVQLGLMEAPAGTTTT
jgi:ketosteroid isomerase-like protein